MMSFCVTDFVGDDGAFGKLKLLSDSGLITLLRGEKKFETSKIVVSKMLVYRLGSPHLKHSQLTLLSPLYTQYNLS